MKTKISTSKAPGAIGPYSQAIRFGNLLFCSGQIAIDPATNQVITGNVQAQTERVLKNIQGILEEVGLNFSNVLKTTIFLKNMSDFQTVNEMYGSYFKEPFPARSTVEVSRLPKDVLVEIEILAHFS